MTWNMFQDKDTDHFLWKRELPNGWIAVVRCVSTTKQSEYTISSECDHCISCESEHYSDLSIAKAAAVTAALRQSPCAGKDYECAMYIALTREKLTEYDKALLAGRAGDAT